MTVVPTFDPLAIYRDSALTDRYIRPALYGNDDLTTLKERLWRLWRSQAEPQQRGEALAALLALGEDIMFELETALTETSRRLAAEYALRHLERTVAGLRDAVARSGDFATSALQTLLDTQSAEFTNEAGMPYAIFHVLARTVIRAHRAPFQFTQLKREDVPVAAGEPLTEAHIYTATMQADAWFRTFAGYSDDAVYNVAVLLDTMVKDEALINLLSCAVYAPNRQHWHGDFDWRTEILAPRPRQNEDDIPLEVYAAIDSIDLSWLHWSLHIGLRTVFVERMSRYVAKQPDLTPEIMAFGLQHDFLWLMNDFAPESFQERNLVNQLLAMVRQIRDPYHKARALVRLRSSAAARAFSAQGESIVDAAIVAAKEIIDPHRRVRVLELLIADFPPAKRADLLSYTEQTCLEIADMDDRCRALPETIPEVSGRAA